MSITYEQLRIANDIYLNGNTVEAFERAIAIYVACAVSGKCKNKDKHETVIKNLEHRIQKIEEQR